MTKLTVYYLPEKAPVWCAISDGIMLDPYEEFTDIYNVDTRFGSVQFEGKQSVQFNPNRDGESMTFGIPFANILRWEIVQ